MSVCICIESFICLPFGQHLQRNWSLTLEHIRKTLTIVLVMLHGSVCVCVCVCVLSRDLNPTNAAVWTVSLHLTENASCILGSFYSCCSFVYHLSFSLPPSFPPSLLPFLLFFFAHHSAETLLNFYQLCFRTGSVAEMLGKASLWDEESSGILYSLHVHVYCTVHGCVFMYGCIDM